MTLTSSVVGRPLTPKSSGIELDVAVASIGSAEDANDDFAGVTTPEGAQNSPRGWLAVIADGVSSSVRGRVAAHTTGEALFADLQSTPIGWDTTVALDRIVSAHNEWLWRQNQTAHSGGMECTLTALVVGSRYFTVAHVGDCRCYLIRGKSIFQLTQDHTRNFGSMHQRGPLTRALGVDDRVLVDYRQEPVQLDDVFVLVSDGVWSVLRDDALLALVSEAPSAREAVDALCRTARSRGSTDDASAIVLRVLDWSAHDLPVPSESGLELDLPPPLKPEAQIDGLVVEHLVSSEGVSRVYRVRDPATDRSLALKTLARGRGALQAERGRIAREHWLSAHAPPCVARAVMPREAPSAFYYLFEWLEGETLAGLTIETGPRGTSEFVRLARECMSAIGALHRRGIIHRDIKPENLVRQSNGQVRVLDLGIAITRRRDDRSKVEPAGTPAYINPEQWGGAPPDERSDVFALGVTLFNVLTKALPYGPIEPYQTARYQRDPRRVTQLRPDVPLWLDVWLTRTFCPRHAERYETIDEMMLALERASETGSLQRPDSLPLLERGTTGLLWIGLTFSLLLNLLLIALLFILQSG
ncbi:MAG TPA: bifunctional protein-serine/threonine kinase/phosphatase [Polyangiaceae bacterium]